MPKLRELALEEYCFIGGKDNTNVLKMKSECEWRFGGVDLESLRTITSKGSSFCYTKVVDLESGCRHSHSLRRYAQSIDCGSVKCVLLCF